MQLSPLTDLFFASAPPAAAGPGSGLDPSTAPFAQWLSSQLKSAAPLADPATLPPFSQFPLNWGFPATSALVAEPAAAPLAVEALWAGEIAGEGLPVQALAALPKPATAPLAAPAGGEVNSGVPPATDRSRPKLPEPPAATPGVEAYWAGEGAAQVLTAEVLAALPKPATSPLATLAGGEAKPDAPSATASRQPSLPAPPGPETGWPSPAPARIAGAAAAPDSPTADPAVVAAPPRQGRALVEAAAAELATAPPSPLEPVTRAARADNSTAAAVVTEPSRSLTAEGVDADIELPAFMAAPAPQPRSAFSAPKAQEQSAAIASAAPELEPAAAGAQPVAPPASEAAPPRAVGQRVAIGIPQGRSAPAVPSSGVPLHPDRVVEVPPAEIGVANPAVAARPNQGANPGAQGMPGQNAETPARGFEPAPAAISGKATAAPVLPAQAGWDRPAAQPAHTPPAEPLHSAAIQGGPKVVPVTPEAAVAASMVSGMTPQSQVAAATLAGGQIAPVATGNIAAGPRPSAGFRPASAWASVGSPEATTPVPGLSSPAETGFNPLLSRPVASAAGGQPNGERSLSDQRFASLFAPAATPVQALSANTATPQQAAVAPAAGFESLLQPMETTGTELTASPLVTAPLGQPAAPLASTPPTGPLLTLPSGQQVPEQEVLQQLFHQLPSRASGPQRVTLRLNPEELGEVRLEMIIEKETVRAHLQAQSQQVQEVLEKHLPRLREAFEQQGLKLQELQVSVDSGRDGGRSFFSQSQHQQPAPNFSGSGNPRRHQGEAMTEAVVPPPSPRSSGGLSLRV